MLDDCSQSLHSLISLDKQFPQLVDGLVLPLCLLFALVLFGRESSVCNSSTGHARLRCILKAGCCFGAGSWPSSCFEPKTRSSICACPSVGGINSRHWENWRHWCICIHHVWYLARNNTTKIHYTYQNTWFLALTDNIKYSKPWGQKGRVDSLLSNDKKKRNLNIVNTDVAS